MHPITIKREREGRRGSRRFLGFGKSNDVNWNEMKYLQAGIKPSVDYTYSKEYDFKWKQNIDALTDYAEDNALSYDIEEWTDKNGGDWVRFIASANPEISIKSASTSEEFGETFGYPEKAIEGFITRGDENALTVRDTAINDWGISQEDYELLEFVPYGLDKEEIEEEIKKRKEILE